MATKRLSILLGFTVVLWCGILLWAKYKPEHSPTQVNIPWIEFTLAAVKRLTIAPANAPTFSLINEAGHWYVLQTSLSNHQTPPPRMHADRAEVEAILTLVNQTKPKRSLDPLSCEKANEFGLDNPTTKLIIDREQDTPWSLQLGSRNPTGDSIFGQASSGNNCLLLDIRYQEHLNRKAETFYDKRVFNIDPETVSKLRLEGLTTATIDNFELTRDGTTFTFTWPENLRSKVIAAAEVNHFLHDLTGTQVQAFMETQPTLSKPYLTLSVWTTSVVEPQNLILYTRGTGEDIFIGKSSRHELFFTLNKHNVAKLAIQAFSLRDRRVLSIDINSVRRQRLVRYINGNLPPTIVIAERTNKGWQGTDRKDLPTMDTFLWRLNDLKYTAEPIQALPKTAVPILNWELFGVSPNSQTFPVTTVEFYQDQQLPDKTCWARLDDKTDIFPVPNTLLDDLLIQLENINIASPKLDPKTTQ